MQVGLFTERQAKSLRLRLRNGLPADSWSFESNGDAARWIIYMGKYISKEAMNRKRVKLERNIDELDHDLNLVVDAMHEQITWQDAGADPPPRAIKTHVRELVARRREARA